MTANATAYTYSFKDGDGKNKKLLGGKGANLCEMTQIGINVPPGFVITTESCLSYLATENQAAENQELPDELMAQVHQQIKALEQDTGKVLVMLTTCCCYLYVRVRLYPCPA